MASRLSDTFRIIANLREAARRGDWENAGELARTLAQQAPPGSKEELGQLLDQLKETLVVARVSRAHSVATLTRLKAAARFNNARTDFFFIRPKFGEVTDS
jgi:hypothetical protein